MIPVLAEKYKRRVDRLALLVFSYTLCYKSFYLPEWNNAMVTAKG